MLSPSGSMHACRLPMHLDGCLKACMSTFVEDLGSALVTGSQGTTVINPEGWKTRERGMFMHKPTLDQNWDFLRIRVLFPKCDISLHFLHLPYRTDFLHAGNSNFCLAQIPWRLIMAVLRSLIPRPLPPFLHVTLKRQEWPGDEASAVFM